MREAFIVIIATIIKMAAKAVETSRPGWVRPRQPGWVRSSLP
jgi:hypothetical protein